MTTTNFLHQCPPANQQLPNCMIHPYCHCFDVMNSFKFNNGGLESYIIESIDQLEYFIHVIEIHQNKENVIEIPYMCKITAQIFRRMLYFLNFTRRKFQTFAKGDQHLYIDFPHKSIQVLQYLHYLVLYYNYLDSTIEILLHPNSELNISSLKEVLFIHLELLFVFQQFINFKRFGFSFCTRTKYGKENRYQIFVLSYLK